MIASSWDEDETVEVPVLSPDTEDEFSPLLPPHAARPAAISAQRISTAVFFFTISKPPDNLRKNQFRECPDGHIPAAPAPRSAPHCFQ